MRIYLHDDWIRAVYYDAMHGIVERIMESFSYHNYVKVAEWANQEGVIPKIIREFVPIQVTLFPYPNHDIQKDASEVFGQFDFVIADQVLEHVPDFIAAIRTCVHMTIGGGYLIFGTPWLYPYHAAPKDYWRISVDGYEWLFHKFGIETVEIAGWGNQQALIHGNQMDSFLAAVRCRECYISLRDPNAPCPQCGASGSDNWVLNRTVMLANSEGLFETNEPEHYIEVWAVGKKIEPVFAIDKFMKDYDV